MDDKKQFSETVKTIKLLMSSLFARKQPYMVVNGNKPGVFYYTNIDHDRVALYRTNIDDVLSRVIVKEPFVMEAFKRAFPTLANSIAQIDLMSFSSGFNLSLKNNKGVFPEIVIDEKSRIIYMHILNGENPPMDKVVGILLTDLDPEFYEQIISNFESFSDDTVKRSFRATENVGDDRLTLEIVEVSNNSSNTTEKTEFALPFMDGFSGVSAKEYIRKREGLPVYDILLRCNRDHNTSKAAILYGDDWLDAMTIMPGSLWFLSRLCL